jgi:tetratricopeptide (TPR) repeat protein
VVSSRMLPLLRLAIVVMAVLIVVALAFILRDGVFRGGLGANQTPRTELERATVSAEEAVKANPNDGTARIKLAAAYLETGATGQALAQAKIAVRLEPKAADPYYMLGLAEAKAGDNKNAIIHLTQAVDTKGQQAQFYQDANVTLARVQEAVGDRKTALVTLGKAIDFGPENTPLLLERASMFERDNKWYLAGIDYAWALTYVPNDSAARTALERIKKDHPKEYAKAVAYVASEVEARPGMNNNPATIVAPTAPSK